MYMYINHTNTHVNPVCIYVTIYPHTVTLCVFILKYIHTPTYSADVYVNIIPYTCKLCVHIRNPYTYVYTCACIRKHTPTHVDFVYVYVTCVDSAYLYGKMYTDTCEVCVCIRKCTHTHV